MLQHAAKFDRFYNIIGNFTAATQDKTKFYNVTKDYKHQNRFSLFVVICIHCIT